MKAIINIGISGSGKSTSNTQYPDYLVISKDIYRKNLVIHDPEINFWNTYDNFDKDVETKVINTMYRDISEAAKRGDNIIVDNTHLTSKKTFQLQAHLRHLGYDVELNNCNDSDNINDYLSHNLMRKDSVDSGVINDQYILACKNNLVPLESNKILIVDIDGTLANAAHRSIFDYKRAYTDTPILYVMNVVKHLFATGYVDYIQFLTGRESYSYDVSSDWLETHGFDMNVHRLLSRATGDRRKDFIIKEEIYENCLKQNKILGLFDDRPQVVEMWWDKSLPVFHVGDFRNQF